MPWWQRASSLVLVYNPAMRVYYDKVSDAAHVVTDCPPESMMWANLVKRCKTCGHQLYPEEPKKLCWRPVGFLRVAPHMLQAPVTHVRGDIKKVAKKLRRKTGVLMVTIRRPLYLGPGKPRLVRFGIWYVDPKYEEELAPQLEDWWDPPEELRRYLPLRV